MNEGNEHQAVQGQGADAEALAEAQFAAAFSEAAGATGSEGAGTGAEEDKAGQGEEDQGGEPGTASGEDAGTPGPDAGGEPPAPDDAETLRRKAQLFDVNQGRLRESQERVRRLQVEIDAARKSPAASAAGEPLKEVPEEIREDVEVFSKTNPDYAALAVEDSRDGERLRKALAEYGPEHVFVAEMADRLAEKRGHVQGKAAEFEQAAQDLAEAHYGAIYAAHPDLEALRTADQSQPENRAKLDAYYARVDSWAEDKPGKEYVEIQRIRKEGTAQEVCALLSRFKEETGPKARQEKVRQAAEAAMAPKGKPSPPPRVEAPEKGSFNDGWDKAGKK